jgi:hypothetical protein
VAIGKPQVNVGPSELQGLTGIEKTPDRQMTMSILVAKVYQELNGL